jgi:hypothetical protein
MGFQSLASACESMASPWCLSREEITSVPGEMLWLWRPVVTLGICIHLSGVVAAVLAF